MLWKMALRETGWRFVVGLGLMLIAAALIVFDYPNLIDPRSTGEVAQRAREIAPHLASFADYARSQWYTDLAPRAFGLFAAVLGLGSVVGQGRAAPFTLSLPVSRTRLLTIRIVVGLAELALLALLPSLALPLLAPSIGQALPLHAALVHAACLLLAGSIYFSVAVLLSTVFDDFWRPLLVALAIVFLMSVIHPGLGGASPDTVMAGETFAKTGAIPWLGLIACAAASAALLFAAAIHLNRRDF